MRISDWSSDVCSSDLSADAADRFQVATQLAGVGAALEGADAHAAVLGRAEWLEQLAADEFQVHPPARIAHFDDRRVVVPAQPAAECADVAAAFDSIFVEVAPAFVAQIGSAACRETGCPYA